MKKGIIVFVLIMFNWALYAQVSTQKNRLQASTSTQATTAKKETDTLQKHVSVKPAPVIFYGAKKIKLKDYKAAVRIDSMWKAMLVNYKLHYSRSGNVLDVPYNSKGESALDNHKLSTRTIKKRLAILDAKTPFDITYNEDVRKMIEFYLGFNKEGLEQLMAKSLYYFPLFEKILDKNNLPLELKYLAVVESGLRPRIKSSVGATGLWQFMFGTGRMMGLTISSYVDERMDPVRSTEAAADYLGKLYEMFGDWDMALASYNTGPGNVSRAIRRSGGKTDYWQLRPYLPRQTARYVPAFIAVMYVFNYAEEYGLHVPQPKAVYFQTETIAVKHTIKFEQIAEVTGIDMDLLEFLNPAYKLNIIPHIPGKHYAVRLPLSEAGLFTANAAVIYAYTQAQLANATLPRYYESTDKVHYRVRRGDYLGKIAARFGVSIRKLKKWNNLNSSTIRVGERLTIYPKKPVDLLKGDTGTSTASAPYYVVQKGDSLWSISQKFEGITISQIKKWNDIRGTLLKPGMRIKISKG